MPHIVKYTLTHGMNTEGKLFRVEKDCYVHFVPDVTLVGLNVRFFINYPPSSKETFLRSEYREIKISNPNISHLDVDCFDNFFNLSPLTISGSFHFYFTIDGSAPKPPGNGEDQHICGSGFLTVDPQFRGTCKQIGLEGASSEKLWGLDGVVLQTYVSKNLGYFPEWKSTLMAAKEGNYNMIHFTPMQELGYSKSAYSIRDQLKVNPNFTPPGTGKTVDWKDVENFVRFLETDWSILSMADLVFNHTSNDSPWLHEHPECAYNVVNSPHLVAAYLLDFIVWNMTLEIQSGALANKGIPSLLVNQAAELPAMEYWLNEQIRAAKLFEFFLADTNAMEKEFAMWLLSGKPDNGQLTFTSDSDVLSLQIAGPRKGRRFGGCVDFNLARSMFVGVSDHSLPLTEAAASAAASRFKVKLQQLNEGKIREVEEHLKVAVLNVLANARYRFYDAHGLKLGQVTKKTPIMWRYFYHPVRDLKTVEQAEAVLSSPDAPRIMAFNGWVMNDDPLRNFAGSSSYVYLRRELIVWGDSAKLRYGNGPEDCPFLWNRMASYAELTARIFHAVRLDNCHSTPLHVAQYMLDRARSIRPNLYVVAELFTGDECLDNIFINKLGLNSLIREMLAATSGVQLGSHVYRYGVTRPAGAFFDDLGQRSLQPTVAHALLYDQTHDNPSVAEKHCPYDFLPLAALCSLACCAIGTTRGYDELVPHNIDVVTEERMYGHWPEEVNHNTAMVDAKSLLNELHIWLNTQGFTEAFLDQVTPDVIAVTRICPQTRESVVLVAHLAFNYQVVHRGHTNFRPIELGGFANRVLLEIRTERDTSDPKNDSFEKCPKFINGLKSFSFPTQTSVSPTDSSMFRVERFTNSQGSPADKLHFTDFPPGSVAVILVRLTERQERALSDLHDLISNQFSCTLHKPRQSIKIGRGDKAYAPVELSHRKLLLEPNSLRMLTSGFSLIDFNRILFRCAAEERFDGTESGPYDIPNHGQLSYCGYQSIAAIMKQIHDNNDLGHPVCQHLRQGDWLAHYLARRLTKIPPSGENLFSSDLDQLGQTLEIIYSPLDHLPRYLVPAYFDTLTAFLVELMHTETVMRMSLWIRNSSSLIKRLAVSTNQFYGFIGNCRLPPSVPPILSGSQSDLTNIKGGPLFCSLAAGLPHFAEGMWRSWGRDTFIAIRGCLLLMNRYDEAAELILSYASLVRHGLIPNLTGEGLDVQPRYNCRDAVWFWLYAIVCYETDVMRRLEKETSKSQTIENAQKRLVSSQGLLNRPVWRFFPSDDSLGWPSEKPQRRNSVADQHIMALHEVIQDALQRHFTGIDFVERRSGPSLDEHMRPEGFRVTCRVDSETGFPLGGNVHNCGTWMDKMGSSTKAGNRGIPATPRDGSAVELVGLAYAVASWLEKAHHMPESSPNYYPHSGVQLPNGKFFTWSDWSIRLKQSFEAKFFIPTDTKDPSLRYNRGIYRDSLGSTAGYTDNQLRPNFLVAMTVAPSLFSVDRGWGALLIARERLLGEVGMRTLAPNDMAYRGDYDNSNDGTDYSIARGFNYHQGPEWLWPTGFYLRARMLFARLFARRAKQDCKDSPEVKDTIAECQKVLTRLDKAIKSTQWQSLPELTNSNGKLCPDSCPAQAWSVGCVMEAAYDLLFPPPLE